MKKINTNGNFFDEGKLRSLFKHYKNIDQSSTDKDLTSIYSSFQPIIVKRPHILGFQSKEMESIMDKVKILLVDGTFEIAPFPFYQLLNFMGITENGGCFINLFHILMEGKKEEEYNDAFLHCRKYLSKMRPSIIITDYEQGLINSLKTLFPQKSNGYPDIKYINCYFHYCQLLKKKI